MKRLSGIGVMAGLLGGADYDTMEVVRSVIGKRITALELSDSVLDIAFEDGTKIRLWDDGQSCCEERYMMTSDNLLEFIGTILLDIEVADGPIVDDGDGVVHEMQFVHVTTNLGVFTLETHNEHNGYYGGFLIRAVMVEEDE